MQNIPIKTLYH